MTPTIQSSVNEVHPEFCFLQMNGGRPLRFAKKPVEGRNERAVLLRNARMEGVEEAIEQRKRVGAAEDDLLDACAAAWTAYRVVIGAATRVPATPTTDSRGLKMEILG